MGVQSFRQLRHEVFRLHAGKQYADALALVERQAVRYPDQWGETLFWRGCLAALVGNLDGALHFLQEAVDRGHWWSEATLRGDPDLKVLQGDARFEALVSVCRQRHAQAEASAKADLLVLPPRRDPPWPVLIALHGAGGAAEEFLEYWHQAAAEGWLVGVPQSSQVVAPGRYGWGDRGRAAREVRGHYQTMIRDYPVDLASVILAGFSQGGATAIWLGLSGLLPVRGILGVACAPRNLDEVRMAMADTPARRLYLVVGNKDHVFSSVTDFCEVLKSAGIAVQLEVRPGLGHDLPDDFSRSLIAGLEFLLG